MDTTGSRISRIVQAAKAKAANGEVQADFVVTEEHIASVIERKTGIPVTKLTQSESQKLLHLEDELHERVVAQEEAIAAVANAVRRLLGLLGLVKPSWLRPWRKLSSAPTNSSLRST